MEHPLTGASWLWAGGDIRRGWSASLFVAVLVALSARALMAGVANARRPRQATGVLDCHGLVIGGVAVLGGIPLGLIGGKAIWQSLATRTNIGAAVEIPWATLVSLSVALIVVGAVLAIVPARSAGARRPGVELRAE